MNNDTFFTSAIPKNQIPYSDIEGNHSFNKLYMKRNLIKTAKHVFEYLIYAIPLLIIFETHLCANPLVKGNFYHNIKKSNGISVKLLERDQEQMTLKTVDVTVTGSVVDHNGEPFPGVTISVPGTGIGTA